MSTLDEILYVAGQSGVPDAQILDRDRLFPGEGIAPLRELASQLNRAGYAGYVSLELFQEEYGGRNALETARTELTKMKDAMEVDGFVLLS